VDSNSLYIRYLSAAAYTLSSGVLTRGALFLASIVLARLLGPRDYGAYSLIVASLLALTPFACLRLDIGLAKLIPELSVTAKGQVRKLVQSAYGLLALVAVPVAILVAAVADPAAHVLYHRPELVRYVRLTAPLLIALAAYHVAAGILMGIQDFRSLAIAQGVVSLVQVALTLPAAWLWRLNGALAAYALAWTFGVVLVVGFVAKGFARRGVRISLRCDWSPETAPLVRFSAGYLLATISWPLSFWCGNAVLTRFRGLDSAGLFSVAFSFAAWTVFLPGYLTNPSLPFLSEACAAQRFEAFRTVVGRNLRLIWLLASPLAIFITAGSKALIDLLYGSRFAVAWPAACLLSLGAVFTGSVGVLSQGFAGSGRVWQAAAMNWLWILSFASLSLLLVTKWGVTGVSVAYLAGTMLACWAYYVASRRALGLKNTRAGVALVILVPGFLLALALARNLTRVGALLIGLPLALLCAVALWLGLFSSGERVETYAAIHRLRLKMTTVGARAAGKREQSPARLFLSEAKDLSSAFPTLAGASPLAMADANFPPRADE
jgi:O-antigen/teichoic acid export membrane protein